MARNAFDIGSYGENQGGVGFWNLIGPILGLFTGPQNWGKSIGGIADAFQTEQQNQVNWGHMQNFAQGLEDTTERMQDLALPGFNVLGADGQMIYGDLSRAPIRNFTNDNQIAQWQSIVNDPNRSELERNLAQYALDTEGNNRGLPIYDRDAMPLINLDLNPAQAGADAWNAFSQAQDLTGRANQIGDPGLFQDAEARALGGTFGMEGVMSQVQDLLGGLPGRVNEGLEGIRGDVSEILRGGRVDADALANRIMGLYPTEGIDASADIAQLGLLAKKMDQQARQGMSTMGPAPQQALDAAGYEYRPQLAAAGLQAEQAADKFNIGLQQAAAQAGATGMTLAEQINAGLVGQEANLIARLGEAGLGTESTAAQALANTLSNLTQGRAGVIQGSAGMQHAALQQALDNLIRLGSVDAANAERSEAGELASNERLLGELLRQDSAQQGGIAFENQNLQALMNAIMNPGALGQESLLASDFLKNAFPGWMGVKPEEPEEPSFWEQMAGPVTGGASAAGQMYLMKMFMPTCIDGEARVPTPTGLRKLKTILVGETVYDYRGEETEVVERDYGHSHPGREHDFIEIEADHGSLVCTKDHVVEGRRADSWKVGEVLPSGSVIRDISSAWPVPCGDIKLKNGYQYLANGFAITSMFDKESD